jgi:hypothetical protein
MAKSTTYSGQGYLSDMGLRIARAGSLPPCTPVGSLAPDTMAIVEFAISDDGRAMNVTPIHVRRGVGDLPDARPEEVFVEAVRGWSWNAETVAKLDPFWRQSIRIELRCLDEGPGTESGVWASFNPAVAAWLAGIGVGAPSITTENPAQWLVEGRAELIRREAAFGPSSPQLIPLLLGLSENPLIESEEAAKSRARLLSIIEPLNPPPELIVRIRMPGFTRFSRQASYREKARSNTRELQALLDELVAQGDGETRPAMLVRTRLGAAKDASGDRDAARAEFERVIASPESLMTPSDPIRVEALIRLSNQAAARRDEATAASALKATGLTPAQCATVDVRPVIRSMSLSPADYPKEALRWNASGFVRVAYDILPSGRATNPRVVSAIPPLLFSDVSARSTERFRFEPVFRPDNSVGCTAATQDMRWGIAPK